MSRHAELVRLADARGYRVNDSGDVIGPGGVTRKPYVNPKKPYQLFSLKDERGRHGHFFGHKLAAFQKFGEAALKPGVHVRHIDGNSLNNSPENLELGSASENMMDRSAVARRRSGTHAASFRRKLTPEQVDEFRRRRRSGEYLDALCAEFGIAKSTGSYIANGRTYPETTAQPEGLDYCGAHARAEVASETTRLRKETESRSHKGDDMTQLELAR